MMRVLVIFLIFCFTVVLGGQLKSVEELVQKLELTPPSYKAKFIYTSPVEAYKSRKIYLTVKYSISSTLGWFPDEEQFINLSVIINERYKLQCSHRFRNFGTRICVQRYDVTKFTKVSNISLKVVRETSEEKGGLEYLNYFNISVSCKLHSLRSQSEEVEVRPRAAKHGIASLPAPAVSIPSRDVKKFEMTWDKSSKNFRYPLTVPVLSDQKYFVAVSATVSPLESSADDNFASRDVAIVVNVNGQVDTSCLLHFEATAAVTNCLQYLDISPYLPNMPLNVGKSIETNSSIIITARLQDAATRLLLENYSVMFTITLFSIQSPFHRWRSTGISNEMLECSRIAMRKGWFIDVEISNNGEGVDLRFLYPRVNYADSSMPYRLKAMKLGIEWAIQYAKERLTAGKFPDLRALLMPQDEDGVFYPMDNFCTNPFTGKNYSWPPLLAQNRAFRKDNLFVLVPDFSYFTSFWDGHDHGSPDDIWFDVISKESNYLTVSEQSTFNQRDFEEKKKTAVFRGKTVRRKFSELRESITPTGGCTNQTADFSAEQLVDALPFHISRSDMCTKYQAMVTLPGNGVWSWATKFNLLCNSVSMLLSAEDAGGESWETRLSMGLLPYVHYIPLSKRKEDACSHLHQQMLWVRNHAETAQQIAEQGRSLVIGKLGKESILREFAQLLLNYASLNVSKTGR